MGFVDKRIQLASGLGIPSLGAAPTCGDIIDLGASGEYSVDFDQMYLVVDCATTLVATSGNPAFVVGVSTMSSAPTGVAATDALALIGSSSRVFQFGNIDFDSVLGGLAMFGIGPASAGRQLIVGKLTRVEGATPGRYMGLWVSLAGLTAGEGGFARTFSSGTINAYLTTCPPSGNRKFNDGF